MFKYELRPEIRRKLKDPDGFEKGLNAVFLGLAVCMSGVALMLIPTWILILGFVITIWGEYKKFKCK